MKEVDVWWSAAGFKLLRTVEKENSPGR